MLAAVAQKKQAEWEHKEIEKIRKVHSALLSKFPLTRHFFPLQRSRSLSYSQFNELTVLHLAYMSFPSRPSFQLCINE